MGDEQSRSSETRHLRVDSRRRFLDACGVEEWELGSLSVATVTGRTIPDVCREGGEPVVYHAFEESWSAIRADLDRLVDVGIDVLCVSYPVTVSRSVWSSDDASRAGVEVIGPRRSGDVEYGTTGQLRALIDGAHDRDVSVFVEIVDGPMTLFTRGREAAGWQRTVQSALASVARVGADGVCFGDSFGRSSWMEHVTQVALDLGLWVVGSIHHDDPDAVLADGPIDMPIFDDPLAHTLQEALETQNMNLLSQEAARGVVHRDPDRAVTVGRPSSLCDRSLSAQASPVESPGEPTLADAYVLSYPGLPIVRNLDLDDPAVRDLIDVKRTVATGEPIDRYVDEEVYVFEREGSLLVGLNTGDSARTVTVEPSWREGVLSDRTDNGPDLRVEDGRVSVTIPGSGWVMYTHAPEPAVPAGTYAIRTADVGKALDVESVSDDADAGVVQWEYVARDTQHWHVEPLGAGEYRVMATHSGHALTVDRTNRAGRGEGSADGSDVRRNDCRVVVQRHTLDDPTQRWRLEPVADDRFIIRNVATDNALAVDGVWNAFYDGADVCQRADGGCVAHWRLQPVFDGTGTDAIGDGPDDPVGEVSDDPVGEVSDDPVGDGPDDFTE